jgi:putative transposase
MKEYVEKKIRALCEWKRVEILEMTIMPDYIHLAAIIPPKMSVSELMGDIERKNGDSRFSTGKMSANKTVLW